MTNSVMGILRQGPEWEVDSIHLRRFAGEILSHDRRVDAGPGNGASKRETHGYLDPETQRKEFPVAT